MSLIERQKLIEAFVRDIKQFVDKHTILAFTGDLIDKGGKGFKKKDNAFSQFDAVFLKKIRDAYPSLSIFITPGNHDCDRSAVDVYQGQGVKGCTEDRGQLEQFY